jgi:hypothetical protein
MTSPGAQAEIDVENTGGNLHVNQVVNSRQVPLGDETDSGKGHAVYR